MPKANVLALVSTLSDSVADATQVSNYYDDVVFEMAQGVFPGPSLTDAAFVAVVDGQANYSFPTDAVRVLLLHYDTTDLPKEAQKGAELFNKDWRSDRGRPAAFVVADEDRRTVSLIPIPDVDGQAIGVLTPFSATFPAENLTFIFTEERDDVHLDEELPLALEILGREFARDSNHHDAQASDFAKQLSGLLFGLVHRKGR